MATLAKDWEAASQLKDTCKTRVVNIRTGVVLGKEGGAFQQMRLPFWLVCMLCTHAYLMFAKRA